MRRGSLGELVAWASDGVRGEVTLVVAGSSGPVADLASQLEGIRERVAEGERLKDVCADVAAATGLSKKALYDAVVTARAVLSHGIPGGNRAKVTPDARHPLLAPLRRSR